MKKLFTLISIVLLFATGSAQTVTLTFTGRDANNQTVALDSVVINNLTKGWQETLTTPDDMALTLQNGTGIGDVETMCTSSLLLSQNKPNPFDGTTKVNLMVTEPGIVTLDITDVNGRIVRTNRVRPEIGTHQFRVTLSAPGTYVMTARQNGKSSSVKMVCNGTGNGNKIEYIGAAVETRHGTSLQTKSRTRSLTDNPFDLGDEMEYIGFATINGVVVESGHVTQAQNGSETIILTF
ncbi:MAG: T9SS type A sorting domain-containing protein, partial [Bacteroidales bacterium]|nr:T9SS type A sorting domain-containing protein [Bacteroidales bacterium]